MSGSGLAIDGSAKKMAIYTQPHKSTHGGGRVILFYVKF